MSVVGRIHSIESFGTVDGPGIRLVVFMQGCPLRCLYCHNPDTWKSAGGKEYLPSEIIEEYKKNKAFYAKGGITVTGGEPLLQTEFVSELFALAKKAGIHTALDTSGITYNEKAEEKIDKLLDNTDLVLLDIKQIDSEKHKALTGATNENVIAFARHLAERRISIWIRHVVIEGYTDDPDDLKALGRFIGTLRSLKALDVLPYHTLGRDKYRELGLIYPLEGIEPTSAQLALKAKSLIMEGINEVRTAKIK